MERVKGIEPSYSAWEAAALPLSYTRVRSGEQPESAAMPEAPYGGIAGAHQVPLACLGMPITPGLPESAVGGMVLCGTCKFAMWQIAFPFSRGAVP